MEAAMTTDNPCLRLGQSPPWPRLDGGHGQCPQDPWLRQRATLDLATGVHIPPTCSSARTSRSRQRRLRRTVPTRQHPRRRVPPRRCVEMNEQEQDAVVVETVLVMLAWTSVHNVQLVLRCCTCPAMIVKQKTLNAVCACVCMRGGQHRAIHEGTRLHVSQRAWSTTFAPNTSF